MIHFVASPAGVAVIQFLSSPIARKILKHSLKVVVVILLDEAFRKRE